jgi:myo-inositol catabolism protein IolC
MPLNEIPKYLSGETRDLIDRALEHTWQELNDDASTAVAVDKRRLVGTIIALASVGETDLAKLKSFALHAAQAAQRRRLALQNQEGSS